MEKSINPDSLLVPAAQKFYAVVHYLELFKKEKDIIENISYLDSLIEESRNMSFVLQKSLKNTPFFEDYKDLRDKYLMKDVCTWFKDRRDEIVHESPFPLRKSIKVQVFDNRFYCESNVVDITAETEEEYQELPKKVIDFIKSFNYVEQFFSISYSYYEKDNDENLLDKIYQGIKNYYNFLIELNERIHDNSVEYMKLLSKIQRIYEQFCFLNEFFVDDFVYYKDINSFEKGERLFFILQPERPAAIESFFKLSDMSSVFKKLNCDDLVLKVFIQFIFVYCLLFEKQKSLLPTFLILYKDNTFSMESFRFSIKTTLYRKVNTFAKRINSSKDIQAVYFVSEAFGYRDEGLLYKNYKERKEKAEKDFINFSFIDKNSRQRGVVFETSQVNSIEYIMKIIVKMLSQDNHNFLMFNPLVDAFESNDN